MQPRAPGLRRTLNVDLVQLEFHNTGQLQAFVLCRSAPNGSSRVQLREVDRHLLAQGLGRLSDGRQGDGCAGRIQQPMKLTTARAHPPSHLGLRDMRFAHGVLDHRGNDLLDRERLDLIEDALLGKKIIEIGTNVTVAHRPPLIRFEEYGLAHLSNWVPFLVRPVRTVGYGTPRVRSAPISSQGARAQNIRPKH